MPGWASISFHRRYTVPVHTRRKCRCGCDQRITHAGMCNGIAMMMGCELSVRRWVNNPWWRFGRQFGAA